MESTNLTKEDRLLSVCKNKENNIPQLQASLREGRTNEQHLSLTSWYFFESFALKYFFIDKDLTNTKLCFYKCGLLDALLVEKYDEKIINYGLNHLGYALLSDSKELINRYANLSHSSFQQQVTGGTAAPTYALQCLIKDDHSEFERVMKIIKSKTVPKFKMELDASYYEALAEKSKSKIEKIIELLLSPRIHKLRNKEQGLTGDFLSHPALGYAKLAWIKGIEVEVKSPLVPQELLRVDPLKVYKELDLFEMPSMLS